MSITNKNTKLELLAHIHSLETQLTKLNEEITSNKSLIKDLDRLIEQKDKTIEEGSRLDRFNEELELQIKDLNATIIMQQEQIRMLPRGTTTTTTTEDDARPEWLKSLVKKGFNNTSMEKLWEMEAVSYRPNDRYHRLVMSTRLVAKFKAKAEELKMQSWCSRIADGSFDFKWLKAE